MKGSYNIKRVAVLGAGVMGAGIAAHMAGAGISVVLLDIVPKELTPQEEAKGLTIDSLSVRNRFAQAGKDRVVNPKSRSIYDPKFGELIEIGNFDDHMSKIKDYDLIIEVVMENLEIKKSLMLKINDNRKEGSIVATNTSGVPINKICEDMPLEFKQHFLGTHFFNPPRYMKLLEIIPTEDTLPEITEYICSFGEKRLGKGIVKAKDTPNFIANRIGTYATAVIVNLTEQYGYSFSKADKITGTPIGRPKGGTFRTLDMVGIDIYAHVSENLRNSLPEGEEKESLAVLSFVNKMLEQRWLGDKTGQGFYKKIKNPNKLILQYDPKLNEYVEIPEIDIPALTQIKTGTFAERLQDFLYGDTEESKFAWEAVKKTLLYSASKVPEITDKYEDIDLAMMWGYNWKLGPFALWDALGVAKSIKKMEDEGESIPKWVKERIAIGNANFYSSVPETLYINLKSPKVSIIKENKDAELLDIGDGVACLSFKTKGNTLTDRVIDMMYEAVEEVEKNWEGLVVGNQSSGFSAGANLMQVVQFIQKNQWDKLSETVNALQFANMALKYCTKPVITAPYGTTLGGGAEVAMHGHKILAHAETYMGLVEVGVGLVPGGGGIKELLIRKTENLDLSPINDYIPYIKDVWQKVAMGTVSSSGHDALKMQFLRKNDRVVMNLDYLIEEAKKEVLALSQSGYTSIRKKKIKVVGITGKASLLNVANAMLDGGYISEYDHFIASKIATIVTGGDVVAGSYIDEEQILALEKEAFVSLCSEEKTQKRIEHMLRVGKPLRN
jgi:3-hydroxyacyl-CoA dehydrogenase